jgi:NADH dehydrogenase
MVETDGGRRIQYRHLVLATGARPLVPPIPGVKANNIVSVRSLQDLEHLRSHAVAGKRAVVVGGGYIGVEVAVALRHAGLEVALVEMLPRILMTTTEPEFIEPIEQSLAHNGVKLLTGRKVTAFDLVEGHGTRVRLDDGESLEADVVVLSVGVLPRTGLAEASGIRVSRWGIVADEFLRTSAGDVYTAGDCAEKKSLVTGLPIRGEFGTNAVFMGRVVAQNILGREIRFPGVINTNASTAFDWATGSAGLTEAAARDAGMDVATGRSEVADRYPMMDGLSTIHTKLVFVRSTRKLVGGSVLRHGHCCAANVDFLSLAIQMGATADDLVRYQYATHPELAAKPSDNTYVFACMAAIKEMHAHSDGIR